MSEPRRRARGVVLLTLLIALMLASIGLMAAVDVWSVARQREREQELLFVGEQYRLAIQSYYYGAPPGARRQLPARLDDLLEDNRYPVPVRHLRRLYPDPVTASSDWGLVRIGDGIAGVYSLSDKPPIKQAGFAPAYEHFNGRTAYSQWIFASQISGLPRIALPPAGGIPGIDAPVAHWRAP
jgi:type II secretory pathway pseudopilin PulG